MVFRKANKFKKKIGKIVNNELSNKIEESISSALTKLIMATMKIQREANFNGSDNESIQHAVKLISKHIERRALYYVLQDREEYKRHTTLKTAKVAEVIEVYTELIARGYSPAEAMVEIGENISFDIENKEIADYNFDKYRKRRA